MYANVTVENIITKGKRYDVKYSERIAPKVSFVGDDGNTHELNARYFGDTKLVRCIVSHIQDMEYGCIYRVGHHNSDGRDRYVLQSDAGDGRFLPMDFFEDVENQVEPNGYVGRFIGHCDGFTHLKNYNIEQVISGGEYVRVRNDKGTLSIMDVSLFEKLGEVTQEAEELVQKVNSQFFDIVKQSSQMVLKYIGVQIDGKLEHGGLYNCTPYDDQLYKVVVDNGATYYLDHDLFEVTQEADETDQRKSTKYRKQIPSGMEYLDVYRVCALFNVQDTTGGIHQAIKKLLAAGNRGYKNREEDLQEAIDAIQEVMKIDKEIE